MFSISFERYGICYSTMRYIYILKYTQAIYFYLFEKLRAEQVQRKIYPPLCSKYMLAEACLIFKESSKKIGEMNIINLRVVFINVL